MTYILGGSTIHSGVVTPENSFGNDGDAYIVTGEEISLFFKKNSQWIEINIGTFLNFSTLDLHTDQTIKSDNGEYIPVNYSLNALSDVNLSTVQPNEILKFDGSQWINQNGGAFNISRQILAGSINPASGSSRLDITSTASASSGSQIWSRSITTAPGSTKIRIDMDVVMDSSSDSRYISIILLRGSTVLGVFPTIFKGGLLSSGGGIKNVSIMHIDTLPNSNGDTYTYSARACIGNGNGTWYIGQDNDGNNFGNKINNTYSLMEIL